MIKRIAALALCLMLSMSLCAFAVESTDTATNAPAQSDTMPPEGMQPGGGRGFGGRGQRPQGGMTPPQGGEFQPGTMPTQGNGEQSGSTPPQMPAQDNVSTENTRGEQNETAENPVREFGGGRGPMQGENMPQFNGEQNVQTEGNQTASVSAEATEAEENFFKKYSTPLFSMVLLGLAFVFVIFYKRKTF